MRPALDRVRSSVRPGETAYLVDRNGDYLIHPDRNREFGSQRGTPTDWRRDMPYFASSLGATKGFAIEPQEAARPAGTAFAPAVLAGSEWVAFIQWVPRAVFMAPAKAIRNSSVTVGSIAVLCAALLALLIARSLTRPIVQLTKAIQATHATESRHSGRSKRRNRRTGARVCAGDGGSERQNLGART
jgi:hypothetical protein